MSGETTPNPSIPAGWYPDPADPEGKRWWDGARWTQDVQAAPAPVPVFASQAPLSRTLGAYQPAVVQGLYSKATIDTGIAHTRASWWLAASPFWLVIPQVLIVSVVNSINVPITAPITLSIAGLSLVLYVVLVRLAFADRAALLAGGNATAATPWWTLLSPLAYLIARGLEVRKYEEAGAWAPLVWWVVAAILTPGVAVLSVFAAYGLFAA
jgi:Protein of unknown function (DUF2510)